MTAQEVIATIRAEIERLKNHAISSRAEFIHVGYTENAFAEDSRITVYDHLLSFLANIEKSLPINSELRDARRTEEEYQKVAEEMRKQIKDGEELNGEIDKFLNETGAPYCWCNDDEQKDWCTIIARHFYDLGCRRTAEKYDEIEYERQREEGVVLPGFEDDPEGIPGKDFVPVEWVETLERYGKWKIVKLEEDGSSEIPNDLEEAANVYSNCYSNPDGALAKAARRAYITGAKWQKEQDQETIKLSEINPFLAGVNYLKEQMMKDAVEGEITKDNRGNNVVRTGVFNNGFEIGDKVRVIVLKKED